MIYSRNSKIIFTEDEIKHICELYKSGKSSYYISELYKIGSTTVQKLLRENNIEIRDNRNRKLKYYCDDTYFNIIDTEHKAYWLGFIYADGFITSKAKWKNQSFGIALHIQDIDHLYKLKNELKSDHPIYVRSFTDVHGTRQKCELIISNPFLVNGLKEQGVIEKKSLILTFPNDTQVPENLISHFIRGYFDGDGSVYKNTCDNQYNISIMGTKEFLETLKMKLNINTKLSRKNTMTTNNYNMRSGGNKKTLWFLNYIYKDATIYLNRKYEKYLDLLKYYNL